MKKKKIIKWVIVVAITILLLVFLLPSPQETTQKQHNFPIGDNTEHVWTGDNGEVFAE